MPTLGELPGSLAPGEAAADDVNLPDGEWDFHA
jgi:hypothetical protein